MGAKPICITKIQFIMYFRNYTKIIFVIGYKYAELISDITFLLTLCVPAIHCQVVLL